MECVSYYFRKLQQTERPECVYDKSTQTTIAGTSANNHNDLSDKASQKSFISDSTLSQERTSQNNNKLDGQACELTESSFDTYLKSIGELTKAGGQTRLVSIRRFTQGDAIYTSVDKKGIDKSRRKNGTVSLHVHDTDDVSDCDNDMVEMTPPPKQFDNHYITNQNAVYYDDVYVDGHSDVEHKKSDKIDIKTVKNMYVYDSVSDDNADDDCIYDEVALNENPTVAIDMIERAAYEGGQDYLTQIYCNVEDIMSHGKEPGSNKTSIITNKHNHYTQRHSRKQRKTRDMSSVKPAVPPKPTQLLSVRKDTGDN